MPQNKEDSTQKKNGSINIVVRVGPKKPKTLDRKNVNKKKVDKKKVDKKTVEKKKKKVNEESGSLMRMVVFQSQMKKNGVKMNRVTKI